ncbi:MAG: hypothetical protein Q7T82_12855 [Armatimonadota bacterium]|nr:hypothetical protein [Armatimonadota bacterium]
MIIAVSPRYSFPPALACALLMVLCANPTDASRAGSKRLVTEEFRMARSGAGDVVAARFTNNTSKPQKITVSKGDFLVPRTGSGRLVIGKEYASFALPPRAVIVRVLRAYQLSRKHPVAVGAVLAPAHSAKSADKLKPVSAFVKGLSGSFGQQDVQLCQAYVWQIAEGVNSSVTMRSQGWNQARNAPNRAVIEKAFKNTVDGGASPVVNKPVSSPANIKPVSPKLNTGRSVDRLPKPHHPTSSAKRRSDNTQTGETPGKPAGDD